MSTRLPDDPGQVAHAGRKVLAVETWDALRSRRNVPRLLVRAGERGGFGEGPRGGQARAVGEELAALELRAGDRPRPAPRAHGVWQGAWHVGGAAAAIAIVAPNPPDDRWAGLLQYDLGHATMLMMLAAADLGIGTCHSSVQDQELARKILGFPEDYFLAYLSRSAIRPTGRSGRLSGSTGDRSTRSSTATAGSGHSPARG